MHAPTCLTLRADIILTVERAHTIKHLNISGLRVKWISRTIGVI
jgi:hypothetical protein